MSDDLTGLPDQIPAPERKKPGRKPGWKAKSKEEVKSGFMESKNFDLKVELFKVMTAAFPDPCEVLIKLLPLGHPKLASRRLGPHYYVQIKGMTAVYDMPVVEKKQTKDGGEMEVPVMKPTKLPLGLCCLVPKDAGPEDLQDYVDKLKGDHIRYQDAA